MNNVYQLACSIVHGANSTFHEAVPLRSAKFFSGEIFGLVYPAVLFWCEMYPFTQTTASRNVFIVSLICLSIGSFGALVAYLFQVYTVYKTSATILVIPSNALLVTGLLLEEKTCLKLPRHPPFYERVYFFFLGTQTVFVANFFGKQTVSDVCDTNFLNGMIIHQCYILAYSSFFFFSFVRFLSAVFANVLSVNGQTGNCFVKKCDGWNTAHLN